MRRTPPRSVRSNFMMESASFTDVNMPVLDERISTRPLHSRAVVSGENNCYLGLCERATERPAYGTLSIEKPYDPMDVARKLKELVAA